VITGIGNAEFDAEGRYVEARFDNARRKLSIISCYLPSGSSGDERQQAKFRFMTEFRVHLARLGQDVAGKAGRQYLLCGDWNIAHKEIDLKNWRSNRKNSGFLPEERAWLTEAFDRVGWVDVFRTLDPRPEYKARTKEAGIIKNFKGRAWVDEQDHELARLEVEAGQPVGPGDPLVRLSAAQG